MQRCFELGKEKVFKGLQLAEAVQRFSVLEAELRDQLQGQQALQVSGVCEDDWHWAWHLDLLVF